MSELEKLRVKLRDHSARCERVIKARQPCQEACDLIEEARGYAPEIMRLYQDVAHIVIQAQQRVIDEHLQPLCACEKGVEQEVKRVISKPEKEKTQ